MRRIALLISLPVVMCGCATTQGNYQALGSGYPPRPDDCKVLVFKTDYPQDEFIQISRLNVHLEKTMLIPSDFEEAEAELEQQACRSGADAIIDVEERSSTYLETRMYNVSAIGVVFKRNVPKP